LQYKVHSRQRIASKFRYVYIGCRCWIIITCWQTLARNGTPTPFAEMRSFITAITSCLWTSTSGVLGISICFAICSLIANCLGFDAPTLSSFLPSERLCDPLDHPPSPPCPSLQHLVARLFLKVYPLHLKCQIWSRRRIRGHLAVLWTFDALALSISASVMPSIDPHRPTREIRSGPQRLARAMRHNVLPR
jgi:hypothetical protein